MKVILLTDVPKVGNRYDIKDLKEGFAQNVLISKGLAVLATKQELAKLTQRKEQIDKKKADEQKAFENLISQVGDKTIVIGAKANEKGHLFKAVGKHDIAVVIKNIAGIEIDEDAIILPNIKELGKHTVTIKRGDKSGKCEVVVEKI